MKKKVLTAICFGLSIILTTVQAQETPETRTIIYRITNEGPAVNRLILQFVTSDELADGLVRIESENLEPPLKHQVNSRYRLLFTGTIPTGVTEIKVIVLKNATFEDRSFNANLAHEVIGSEDPVAEVPPDAVDNGHQTGELPGVGAEDPVVENNTMQDERPGDIADPDPVERPDEIYRGPNVRNVVRGTDAAQGGKKRLHIALFPTPGERATVRKVLLQEIAERPCGHLIYRFQHTDPVNRLREVFDYLDEFAHQHEKFDELFIYMHGIALGNEGTSPSAIGDAAKLNGLDYVDSQSRSRNYRHKAADLERLNTYGSLMNCMAPGGKVYIMGCSAGGPRYRETVELLLNIFYGSKPGEIYANEGDCSATEKDSEVYYSAEGNWVRYSKKPEVDEDITRTVFGNKFPGQHACYREKVE